MGIPKYHKWLTERYPKAFAEAGRVDADHVYLDVNALLHDCMRWATSETDFFQKLFSKLDTIFRTVSPQKSVFFAVDGPASCAKCLTQRQRRRAHAQKDARNVKGKGNGKTGALSNNMLTPGVPFMTKLTSALEYYSARCMKNGGAYARCEFVTVSGAHAIGEGEHKIVSQMLRNAGSATGESHVVFSGDADIFLLSLVQSACRRVRVVSERPDESSKKKRGHMLQIWDAEILASYLHKEIVGAPGKSVSCSGESAIRRDFALVSLLAGNDYLPELRCSLNPQQLWNEYLSLRRKSYPTESIVQATLCEETVPLSHLEEGWASSVGEVGSAFVAEPYEHFSFYVPFLISFMKVASKGTQARPDAVQKGADGVRKYLEGLLWILEMYHYGYCADFFYVFEKSQHPYAAANLIVNFLNEDSDPVVPPRSGQPPMKPLSCAICILPVQNAEQFLCPVAKSLRPMFKTNHALLGDVNSIERSDEVKNCKARLAELNKELQAIRDLGRDDSAVKAELTAAQQRIQSLKKGGSDIDVVPLHQVDAEVQERCAGTNLPVLSFSPDVTLARCSTVPGSSPKPLSFSPPSKSMASVHCEGIVYLTGEWPQATPTNDSREEVLTDAADGFDCEYEMGEEEDELLEGGAHANGTSAFEPHDVVEVYWPDDDTWLPAIVMTVRTDDLFQIKWKEDGSLSDVPADYVRHTEPTASSEAVAPARKRMRVC